MRLWKMLGCAALGLLLAAPARAENIKIGVMLPYSGVNADLGDVQDKAIDLFMKLHGKDLAPNTVELIKRDEGPPSGANAKTVATELITRDKVKLILGVVFSPSAIAMAPVMTQAKIPLVIANAGTAWITTLSPYIVRFSFSMWHDAYPMGTYAAKDLKCSTAAMGYTDFPPGKDSTEAFKVGFEKAGGKIVDAIPMGNPAQVPDMTPFFQRVKDQKPDCFYVFIPSGAHASAVVKTYGEVGLKQAGVKLIGPKDVVPDSKLQTMGDAAIGTIVMSSYSDDLDNAVNKQFIQAWHDAYGADNYPDFMSAAAWDAMNAVFHTIKELNGKIDDGLKFVDALKNWSGEGPRGNVKIDPATRDIVQDERAMEVYRKPDGKLGTKVLGTIPQVKDECKELKLGRCGGQ
ncbi:MAG: branched-chain amino acid transport system substrate-binding protein [Alphaproteobacteria bacterium]|nr:branched-chain amino acid transport system substrate-binding protein [Alphaproteobacteria bacterium]